MIANAMFPSGSNESNLFNLLSMFELNIRLGIELPKRDRDLAAYRLMLYAKALSRWYSLLAAVFYFTRDYVIFYVTRPFGDCLIGAIFV